MLFPPPPNEKAFEERVHKLRVPELKLLLQECLLPVDGTKLVLTERLLHFCVYLTEREKNGIFRLLHTNDANNNERKPVTLPYHLGPVTLISGGDDVAPEGHIPMGYESVRRFPIEDKGVSKVFSLHYLKCNPALSFTEELKVKVVHQVSVDTPKGVRTFQSTDPSGAFYTAVLRALQESEGLSSDERDRLIRKTHVISVRGLGKKLMGLDQDTCVGKMVQRAAARQHQKGCYRGTEADVACLNRFTHLSKYHALPVLPPGHRGPPPPHQALLKPWEAPAHVAALVQSPEDALAHVLEVFFPLWECQEGSILLLPKPIEGGRGQFSVDVGPKVGDKDKYFFVFLKRTREGTLDIGAFPYKLKVHLNNSVLSIPSDYERVDITKQIKSNVNNLRTEVTVDANTPEHYFAVVRLFAKSKETLMAHVQAQAFKLDKPQALRQLQTFIGEQDAEVEAHKVTVELNCPISRSRMEIPVRGADCKHMQCFDARWFVTVFEGSRSQRKCTVCQTPIPTLRDLVIDGLQVQMLRDVQADESALSVHLARDGSWVVADRERGIEGSEQMGDALGEIAGEVGPGTPLPKRRREGEREGKEEGDERTKKSKSGRPRSPEVEIIDVDAEERVGEEEEEEEEEEAVMRDDYGHPLTEEVEECDGGSFFDLGGGAIGLADGGIDDESGTSIFDPWLGTFLPKEKRDDESD